MCLVKIKMKRMISGGFEGRGGDAAIAALLK